MYFTLWVHSLLGMSGNVWVWDENFEELGALKWEFVPSRQIFFTVIMICNSSHLFIMCESTLLVPSHETVTLHAEIEKMQRETSRRNYLKVLEVLDRKIIVQSEFFLAQKNLRVTSTCFYHLEVRQWFLCMCVRLPACGKSQHDWSSYKYIYCEIWGHSLVWENDEKVPHSFVCWQGANEILINCMKTFHTIKWISIFPFEKHL